MTMPFTIKAVTATMTLIYDPDFYLEKCKEEGVEPSNQDFLDFIEPGIFEDFGTRPCLEIEHISANEGGHPQAMTVNQKAITSMPNTTCTCPGMHPSYAKHPAIATTLRANGHHYWLCDKCANLLEKQKFLVERLDPTHPAP